MVPVKFTVQWSEEESEKTPSTNASSTIMKTLEATVRLEIIELPRLPAGVQGIPRVFRYPSQAGMERFGRFISMDGKAACAQKSQFSLQKKSVQGSGKLSGFSISFMGDALASLTVDSEVFAIKGTITSMALGEEAETTSPYASTCSVGAQFSATTAQDPNWSVRVSRAGNVTSGTARYHRRRTEQGPGVPSSESVETKNMRFTVEMGRR